MQVQDMGNAGTRIIAKGGKAEAVETSVSLSQNKFDEQIYYAKTSCPNSSGFSGQTNKRKRFGSHPLRIEHDPLEEALQELEYDIFRAAKYKYDEQTWLMYDRIMEARIFRSHKNYLQRGCASTVRSMIVATSYVVQVQHSSFEFSITNESKSENSRASTKKEFLS
jgi:glucan biosynthesis protein